MAENIVGQDFKASFILYMVNEIIGLRTKYADTPPKGSHWTIEWIACRGLYDTIGDDLHCTSAMAKIERLAKVMGRTSDSIRMRLENFQRHDPSLARKLGKQHLSGGKVERLNKFFFDLPFYEKQMYEKSLGKIRKAFGLRGII